MKQKELFNDAENGDSWTLSFFIVVLTLRFSEYLKFYVSHMVSGHLVIVVVLCEVGQAGVDVGSKQGKVDLNSKEIYNFTFCNLDW